MNSCTTLASTGVATLPLILLSFLLLLAGVVAVVVLRRRRGAWIAAVALGALILGGITVSAPQAATAAVCGTTTPVVGSDSATIIEDATPNEITGNILTNDSSPSGHALTVTNSGTHVLDFGTLVLTADGGYVYTLDNANPEVDALVDDELLIDRFTYTVSDGHGGAATGVITVTVVGHQDNRAPIAVGDAASITEDATPNTVTGDVLTNDSDADGDTLSVTNPGELTLTYGQLTLSTDGSYTYTLDNTNPTVNALNAGQTLTDSHTYTASDPHGATATASLTITITGMTDNRPPTTAADTNTIKEDATPNPVTGNVLTNDSDADGHTLSVTNAGIVTLTYGLLTLSADGSYTYTLNNTNPAVNALNNGQSLTETFTYSVSDGHGGTASSTLTITITGTTDNRPPVAVNHLASITEDATPNTITSNALVNSTDPDGDALAVVNTGTFTLQYGSLTITANGAYTYTLDNSNVAVNSLNGGQSLSETFAFTITDGRGGISSAGILIQIQGATDPLIRATADTNTVKEDATPNPISGNVLTNDSDAGGFPLTVTNAGTFTLQYGVLVINANGAYTYTLSNSNPVVNALNDGQNLSDMFTYAVSNGRGASALSTITITINGSTDPVP